MDEMKLSNNSGHRLIRIFRTILVSIALLVTVGVVVMEGIMPRIKAESDLRSETTYSAVPTVAVAHPRRGAPAEEIILPANIKPYMDAAIYARTNGYLKSWVADIGSHVKAGQLLAEIDTPEIDHQVQQARADLATAQANYHLSETTAARYQDLLKTDSVSKQEVDSANADFEAKKAVVQSVQANLKRLEELQSFQKIYAPFDGVITLRNTDVGALIDSGGGSPSKELFHIVSTDRMRVYVSIPQVYSREAKTGLAADLKLAEFPGRTFKAKLTTTSQAIDTATRTLLAEFEAANPTGELLPGAYAEVHLHLRSQSAAFILPVTSLLFRSEGLRVGIVKGGNHAELVPVTLGRDFGKELEVLSGIDSGDLIIVNPPDSLITNQAVRVVSTDGGGGGSQ
jgi:RND family efflux transporter MFP subunit